MVGLVIAAICIVAVGVPSYLTFTRAMKSAPLMRAGRERFEAQVGYRFVSNVEVTPEPTAITLPEGRLAFEKTSERTGNETVSTQTWTLLPSRPLRAAFQLVPKELAKSRLAARLVGWPGVRIKKAFAGPHPVGDRRLDDRFVLFADDTVGARSALQSPALVDALERLDTAILDVRPDGVTFSDPADRNLWSAYARAGHSRTSVTVSPAVFDVAAQLHLDIRRLLTLTATAAR